MKAPRVKVLKNLNGVILGITLNGQLIRDVTDIEIRGAADELPQVTLSFAAPTVEFEVVNITTNKLAADFILRNTAPEPPEGGKS